MLYHYGITIREYREKARMTRQQLGDVWPRSNGEIGVSSDYVYLVETGRKSIIQPYTLRRLCDILNIPFWKVGLSEYDPFNPQEIKKGASMYEQTLNTAESLIKRTWLIRRVKPIPIIVESVNDLNRMFDYFRENMPPPAVLEEHFQILYAQVLRLNAVMAVERQEYEQALNHFEQMYTVAKKIDHGGTLAIALLGVGTELERKGEQELAIEKLEEARDESFRASKNVAAFVHAYLARVYASANEGKKFKRAIKTSEDIARSITPYYGDGTDFVFHSLSGILAERSYGYLEIGEPQETLAMKEQIKKQIASEGNLWLDAWIPLDWARAYLMLGEIEKSVQAGKEFYQKAKPLLSPHACSRAYWLLNTLEGAGYKENEAVKGFKEMLNQEQAPLKQMDQFYGKRG
jgi:tetratricopeptide (TPR) repeat protein